jgi:hypothetical protein
MDHAPSGNSAIVVSNVKKALEKGSEDSVIIRHSET